MNRSIYLTVITVLFLFGCKKIDREDLVCRHNIIQTNFDIYSPLSVGNGEFAFTADLTGMQTFPEYYEKGISLGTQSQWGWHSFYNTENYRHEELFKPYLVGNDTINYLYQYDEDDGDEHKYLATEWLRANPHRLHLGVIGLDIIKKDQTPIEFSDVQNAKQQLNLWTGELTSRFEIEGTPVIVTTFCHQGKDLTAFKIESELIKENRLKIQLRLPFANKKKTSPGYDFSSPEKHQSSIEEESGNGVKLRHQIDSTAYYVQIEWAGNASFEAQENHTYKITPSEESTFEISFDFSQQPQPIKMPTFYETKDNNLTEWARFWESGAAVDFKGSTDPRAFELERRVILSQYLMKIQCAGSLPPQETGLTENSWYGKFHMEMYWWHTAHFIMWNRPELTEKSLDYYFTAYDNAKVTAERQGFEGARWQKMTDPYGIESPSTVGPFLIWQQPHIIYLVDLLYRCKGNDLNVLQKYSPLIESTADFMASYARWDSTSNRYILGPAIISAQERFDAATTFNPTFELAYWHWALQTAQAMRASLNLEPKEKWQHVIDHLSELPVQDSVYLFAESAPDSYTNPRYLTDHPIIMGVLGFLPNQPTVDIPTLEKSFTKAHDLWSWKTCWGWDFPLACMCATMLDKPEMAIDLLLMDSPKNHYFTNGHNYQRETLTIYLPGNGALLSAVALLCTHKNSKGENGFPRNREWKVKYENMISMHNDLSNPTAK